MTNALSPLGRQPSENLPSLPPEGGGVAGAGEPGGTGKVVRLVQAFKRFKWLILGLTVAGVGGGYFATRYIKPAYEVGATIWIESPNQDRAGPVQGEQLLQARAWVELLRTYKVLDPVVRERKLYLSAASGPDSALFRDFDLADRFLPGSYVYGVDETGQTYVLRHLKRMVTETGQVGDSVGRQLGFLWAPRPARAMFGREVAFDIITPREASVKLSERLQSTLRENNFLLLRLSATDPQEATASLNTLITRYVDEAASQKRARLTLLSEVLDSQVTEQAQKLKAAEEALESFRVGTVTLPREETQVAPGLQFTQPTVYTQYFTLRTEYEAIRRDRRALEDVLARSSSGELAVDAFNTIPSVRSAPDLLRVLGELSAAETSLRDSLARYTEEYRGVKNLRERIAEIRTRTIPLYANALIEQLRIQEDDLGSRIATAGRELRELPSRSQNEARLRREVEQAENLFRSLESNRQQARLAEASAIPEVRILDSAVVPDRPSKNGAPSLILLGLGAGLSLGAGIALLLDRLDRRVRYPEQVSQGLGLAILGTIPQVRQGRNVSAEDAAQVIEAFRTVRLNVTHSFPQGQSLAFAISSPSPGDGKSLISSNLALSFAEAGYRVVLVDGDTRRGDLHRTFGVERRPGLLDHLAGEADVAKILRATTHPNLALVPCGTRRSHGPELLGSGRMHDLVTTLRQRYDVVIFDTPPLGAGIDPFVLATATGNMMLILRAGETDRQLAEAKLQVLDRLPVRLLGAVLNDVRVGEGAYKYYSYSYGYISGEEGSRAGLPAGSA